MIYISTLHLYGDYTTFTRWISPFFSVLNPQKRELFSH